MRRIFILTAFLLTACSSEAEDLERQYEIVSGRDDKCRLASETREAWLRQENEREYSRWRFKAAFDCLP